MPNRAILLLFLLALIAGGVLLFGVRREPAPGAAPVGPAVVAPAPPAPRVEPAPAQGNRMVFSRWEIAGRVGQAVERVVGAGRAQVAVLERRGGGRWVCVVAAEQARYVLFDEGQTAEMFPWLADGKFVEPPGPVAKTMSIYLSVAKTAMEYRAERGDRIIVVTCPQEAWGDVPFAWPAE